MCPSCSTWSHDQLDMNLECFALHNWLLIASSQTVSCKKIKSHATCATHNASANGPMIIMPFWCPFKSAGRTGGSARRGDDEVHPLAPSGLVTHIYGPMNITGFQTKQSM